MKSQECWWWSAAIANVRWRLLLQKQRLPIIEYFYQPGIWINSKCSLNLCCHWNSQPLSPCNILGKNSLKSLEFWNGNVVGRDIHCLIHWASVKALRWSDHRSAGGHVGLQILFHHWDVIHYRALHVYHGSICSAVSLTIYSFDRWYKLRQGYLI